MNILKKNTLLLLFACFGISSYAYQWDPAIYQVGKRYPGFIIELDGDTVHGFIEAKERCSHGGLGNSNQNKCEFYLNEKDKKPVDKYGPKEIAGYMIADKFYQSIEYSGGLFKTKNFCLAVKKGRLTTYEWYSTKENFSSFHKKANESQEEYDGRRYNIKTIFKHEKRDNVEEMDMMAFNFTSKMSSLTNDYPELSQKINREEKGYKMLNIFDIIDEYNAYWAKQTEAVTEEEEE